MPYGRVETESAGMHPSVQTLVAKVDQQDPAFMFIAAELQSIRSAGGDLTSETIDQAIVDGRRRHAEYLEFEQASHPGRIPASIVYYVRRGHLVKIGTTRRARARFHALLPDEVLAWEPGSHKEEKARHTQFATLRVSSVGEYFYLTPELRDHIDSIRQTHGAPDPTWPTMQNLPERTRHQVPSPPTTPHLLPLQEACRQAGVRVGTAHVWVHRRKLHHLLEDTEGIKLYLVADLRSLAQKGKKATSGEPASDAA